MTEGQVSYQTAVLPSTVLENLTVDDTPELFYNHFWEFMGVDIQNAYIYPWDFDNILDMVDLAFSNFLQEFKEDLWDKVLIVAYKTETHEDGTEEKIAVHAYHVSKLWDMLRAKMYFKMCRSREGFALKQITESKGTLSQLQRIEGGQPIPAMPGQQQKEGRWRL